MYKNGSKRLFLIVVGLVLSVILISICCLTSDFVRGQINGDDHPIIILPTDSSDNDSGWEFNWDSDNDYDDSDSWDDWGDDSWDSWDDSDSWDDWGDDSWDSWDDSDSWDSDW